MQIFQSRQLIGQVFQRFRHRLWWIDVVWPLLLAGSMIAGLTHLIYSGQRQMRLTNIAEDTLLEFSLVQSGGWNASKESNVLVVSVTDEDKSKFGEITGPGGSDLRLDTYSRLIEKLGSMGASEIYLRLTPEIHDIYGPDFNPLLAVSAALPEKTQLHLGYNDRDQKTLLEIVGKRIHVVDDDECREKKFIQARCSFNTDWDDWVMQNIFATSAGLMNRERKPKDQPRWVSSNFASRYPSYILNLPNPNSLPTTTVSAILNSDFVAMKNVPKMVFIGILPNQANSSVNSDQNPVVQTHYDAMSKQSSVTPLHIFWAQLAEMFLTDNVVLIPTNWIVWTVSGAFCVLILFVLIFFRGPVAFGTFVIYAATGPLINALSIRYLNLYVPMFESFYFGLTTLLIAGFSQLSISALQKWRSDEKRKVHARTSDVKSNFISLLSHNLNTPIAKMQGTLALLSSLPAQGEWKDDVRAAESHVAQLELAVKAVLTATAIEEGALAPSPITVFALVEEIKGSASGPLKRLGVQLAFSEPRGNEDDLHLPIKFDVKTVCVGISSLAALFASNSGVSSSVQINFEVSDSLQSTGSSRSNALEDEKQTNEVESDNSSGLFLICTIESDQRWINGNAVAALRSNTASSVRTRVGNDFLTDVLAGIGLEMVRRFNGVIDLTPRAKGGRILVLLRPESNEPQPGSHDLI